MKRKPQVALFHPNFLHLGGGEFVAACVIEALRDEVDFTLFTVPRRVEVERINACFGTSLRAGDFRVVSPWLVRSVQGVDDCFHFLFHRRIDHAPWKETCLQRAVDRRSFDLVISTANEIGFRRAPALQYVHFPKIDEALFLATGTIKKYFEWEPYQTPLWRSLHALYSKLWRRVSHYPHVAALRGQVTLANSPYTARLFERTYGVPARVVYPPVRDDFDPWPWERKEDGCVAISRVSPDKRLEDLIEIVERVWRDHPRFHLHLMGFDEGDDYARRMRLRCEREPFLHLETNLTRAQLVAQVNRHKYGLHAKPGEHFGIALVEMLHGGAIPFLPHSGGQAEIVDHNPLLCFQTPDQAVEQIKRVLASPDLQAQLRAQLAPLRGRYSVDRFQREIRAAVQAALNSSAP